MGVFAQNMQIHIIDANTGEPIPGVVVWTENNNKSFTSNAQGNAILPFPSKATQLKVSMLGYSLGILEIDPNQIKEFDTIRLKPKAFLDEVVIQSVRGGDFFPVSAKTLSRDVIEAQYHGQDATELLQMTPGVYANFQSGVPFSNYSDIRLRGMEQSRINITLDGIPLNDALDQGVFFSNFSDFANSVQSVQVQRGVGTSTAGTASYAGSINFESMSLRDTAPSAEVQLSTGSFGLRRGSAEAKTGVMSNGVSAYMRYSELSTDGFREHSGSRATSFFASMGYQGKKDLLKFIAFSGKTQNQLAYLPELKSEIQKNKKVNSLSRNQTDDFGQSLVAVQYHRFLSPGHTVAATLYHGWAGGDFEVTDDLVFGLQNNHTGFMSHYEYLPNSAFRLQAGIQGNVFRRENYAFFLPFDTDRLYTNRGLKTDISRFIKAGYTHKGITLFADAQLRTVNFLYTADDRYNLTIPDITWNFFNPKGGISYAIDRRQKVFASIGQAGREPTRRDLLVGLDDITPENKDTTANFSAIKPEIVTDLEVGYQYQSEYLNIQFNYFYMRFVNEIAATGEFTSWGEVLRRNVPESYRQGLELDLFWKPIPEITLSNSTAYTHARIARYENSAVDQTFNEVTPLLTPDWIINTSVAYHLKEFSTLSLTGRYVSRSFLLNENVDGTLPEFFVLNASAQFRLKQKYELRVQANNLLDKTYFTQGTVYDAFTPEAEAAYFAQAGFNFMVTLVLKF